MNDDIPTADGETPSSHGSSLYDTADLSPGGQVYTNTEIGKLFYGSKARWGMSLGQFFKCQHAPLLAVLVLSATSVMYACVLCVCVFH